jgi:hypothetical protein
MPNALYDTGRNAFLLGDIAWDTADIRGVLIDTALYTVDLANHDFLNDIPVGARVGTATALAGRTGVAGVADANDLTFNNVSGATVEAMAIYLHTGTESTSQLIAYIDTATGLPVTPGGGDIVILWDNGTNKIFKL